MEKMDFSKYVGTYTVEEAKQVCKQMEKEILEARKKEAIKKAREKFGNNFSYEVKRGVKVDLTKLKDGQQVCSCDVKGHHILMSEIRENTIHSFISLLENGYQKVIDSDFKEPSLITSLNLLGQDVEFNFNYWLDDGLNSNFNHLDITVKLKRTGEVICNINIVIIHELFQNNWCDIYEDCDDDAVHLRDTFKNIFFCDDDELIDLSLYWDNNEDDFLSHENCPIWINLNHIEITEKHRGKGYGQEILKYIINLLGLNSEYPVSEFYTTDDIVFSVFPYPINLEIDCPIEDFDLTLKMIQKFYKKIGFKDFHDRGFYIYNKNNL